MFSWLTILSLVTKIVSFFNKAFDSAKEYYYITLGKNQKSAEIIIEQDKIREKQIEVIMKPETKEDTIKKLDDGKF